jgi:hypothetical protein
MSFFRRRCAAGIVHDVLSTAWFVKVKCNVKVHSTRGTGGWGMIGQGILMMVLAVLFGV